MTYLRFVRILLVPLIFLAGVTNALAQRFSVSSFRQLPSDVSAFINPCSAISTTKDCGLLKIIASEDFAFSTPLGIVKREDKVGEIWLYLPRGSKR